MNIGDRVRLKEDSEFWGQSDDTVGIIVSEFRSSDFADVKWATGTKRCYRKRDLKLVGPKFKAGDIVVNSAGEKDIVVFVFGMREYDMLGFSSPQEGFVAKRGGWKRLADWSLFKDTPPNRHITLKSGDKITFHYNGVAHKYGVTEGFCTCSGDNAKIFEVIGVNKEAFCKETYGYTPSQGAWPPAIKEGMNDIEALARCIVAIDERLVKMGGHTTLNGGSLSSKGKKYVCVRPKVKEGKDKITFTINLSESQSFQTKKDALRFLKKK